MTEKIDNAAPSQAPEIVIPKKRRGFSLVPDEEKKIQSSEKAEVAAIIPSASSVALTSEGVLTFPSTEKTTAGGTVPPSVAKKVEAIIAAGAAAIACVEGAVLIAAGETGNLPGSMQKGYNEFKTNIKNRFIPGKNGETFVDITETSKPVETTQTPTTVEQTTTTQEATTTTETVINDPKIDGLKFDKVALTLTTEDNRYGYNKDEVVGLLKPNILTIEKIDGTSGELSKNLILLKSGVIKVLQAEALKEKDEVFLPLGIDARNINSLGLMELKSLSSTVKYLGLTVPIGTNFYSPVDADFETFINPNPEQDPYNDEGVMKASFDVKSQDMEGVFRIYTMKENFLLDNKKFNLATVETADGQKYTKKIFHFSIGELMGTIISEKPLRAYKDLKESEDKGEHQLIFQILGRNRSEYLGDLGNILTVDNSLIAYFPDK